MGLLGILREVYYLSTLRELPFYFSLCIFFVPFVNLRMSVNLTLIVDVKVNLNLNYNTIFRIFFCFQTKHLEFDKFVTQTYVRLMLLSQILD